MPEPTLPAGADGKAPALPLPNLASLPATVIALATAVGGVITAYQGYQDSQALSRASYEALKTAVEENTAALQAQAHAQAELRSWSSSAIERSEKRLATLEKTIARKPKPPAPPTPAPAGTPPAPVAPPAAVELTPKPPPAAPTPEPKALPPFDALEKKP